MLAYMGPEGTFSHQAALKVKTKNEKLLRYNNLYDVISAVDKSDAERAIVPIENSIEGSVNATIDTLALSANVYITGEFVLEINENIMVKKGSKKSDIKKLTSHPQPIGQCSNIINLEFPDAEKVFVASTAQAAEIVSQSDGSIACVGPSALAEIYDLDILFLNCADVKNNSTRFVIIEKEPGRVVGKKDKTSIAFTLDNKPGALFEALRLLADANINMLKIESRPFKDVLGKYIFLIDVEGNINDARINFTLDKIKQHTDFYKFLGSYSIIER